MVSELRGRGLWAVTVGERQSPAEHIVEGELHRGDMIKAIDDKPVTTIALLL
jgi:hypothetical protein